MTQVIETTPKVVCNIHKFRAILKELMHLRDINATELARQINLPQPTIHRLLVGKTEDPKLSTLSLIAEYFAVTIDQILGNAPLETNALQKKSDISRSLPIISWEDATKNSFTSKLNATNWEEWFMVDIEASPHSFGLKSKRSMEPRFPTGSLLAVDPELTPNDGDLVILFYKNTNEATIREIILDGPTKRLQSIIDSTLSEELTPDIKIMGVVIQTRFSYK